jgi:hypothetical protein
MINILAIPSEIKNANLQKYKNKMVFNYDGCVEKFAELKLLIF